MKKRARHLDSISKSAGMCLLAGLMVLLAALPGTSTASVSPTLGSAFVAENSGVVELDPLKQWGQWRGPEFTGTAATADPPMIWSEQENLRWKTELPGQGHSSPVVWGDRVFVTAAVPVGEKRPPRYDSAPGAHDGVPVSQEHDFVVLAVDRESGEIEWQQAVERVLPHEGGHVSASLASNSPVTDGAAVYAFFGSRGLHALDWNGKKLWEANFGEMQTKHAHGEGASPVLWKDTLVVNWDHRGESFVVALDKRTGNEKWRIQRDEVTSWATPIVVVIDQKPQVIDEVTSWATPIVVVIDQKPQVIVSGTERIRAYDLATGAVIWECGGLSANVVASPVFGNGMLFAASSYDTRALLAIKLEGAKGDLTGTDHVVWRRTRGTPYVPSPLLYGDQLYFLRHYQPILTRVDAATGVDSPGPIRLNGLRDIYASPVAAAGRVYVTDRYGTTMVIAAEGEPKLLAANRLEDRFNASAALIGKEIFLRGEKSLYSIMEP